jgi:hypothetical protein
MMKSAALAAGMILLWIAAAAETGLFATRLFGLV